MSRIVNIFGGILLLVCIALAVSTYHAHHRAVVAETAAVNAKADTAAGKAYNAAAIPAVKHKEQRNAQLVEAASASTTNAAWADEPVPAAIADVLRKPNAKANPVPKGLPHHVP